MKTEPKATFSSHVVRAAIHANTKFGSDCVCHFAEAIAPGFTACTQKRISSRAGGRWEEDLMWKFNSLCAFRRKRYALVLHVAILFIIVKLIEAHDPFELSVGDLIITKRRKEVK